jgi:hypothetical protein
MKSGTKAWRSIVVMVSIILGLTVAAPLAQSANPGVLPPGSSHFGKTYSQWSAAWWEWALSIPVHSPPFSNRINHPLVDLTGVQCGEGQSGPVWFLGGAFFELGTPALSTIVRNDCIVPSSKALFVPLLNAECTEVEGPGNGCGATVSASRAIVTSGIDGARNLVADIDGVAIQISTEFRVGSADKPTFCVTLPPDDVLSFIGEGPGGFGSGTHFSPGTSCSTVDDGYYVMLAPLSKGPHTLHVHGEIPAFGFTLDVTYHLTAQ